MYMYHESVPTPSLKCRPNIVILGSRNGQYHQNLMQKRQNDVKVSWQMPSWISEPYVVW
jgi:hypothetical protein